MIKEMRKTNIKYCEKNKIAFWKTAMQDLERAEDAYKEHAYPYAVFHAQQCTEKAIKGIMEMEEVFSRDQLKYGLKLGE